LSRKEVQTYAISIGGGFVGIGASLSIWTIGTQAVTSHNSGAGGPDRGTFSARTAPDATNSYHKRDVATFRAKQYTVQIANQSVSGADGVASGDGSNGYKSAFNGTTSSAPSTTPWVSGTSYNQGDVVTFNGKKFRERQPTTANLVLDPEHNFTDWWQLS